MNHGQGCLNFTSLVPPAVPPVIPVQSAKNGARIVGTDVEWGGPLLHNTIISALEAFAVIWDAAGFNYRWDQNQFSIERTGATDRITMAQNPTANSKKFFEMVDANGGGAWIYDDGINIFSETNAPSTPSADNLAIFQFQTGVTKKLQVRNRTTSKNLSGTVESALLWTNTGAAGLVNFNAGSIGIGTGVYYDFAVTNVNGIRFTASAGETITWSGGTTAGGGTITSTVIGSTIRLVAISPTQWFAFAEQGTWV